MKYFKFVGQDKEAADMYDILREAYHEYGTLIVHDSGFHGRAGWKELSNAEIIAYVISKKYPVFKFDGDAWHRE